MESILWTLRLEVRRHVQTMLLHIGSRGHVKKHKECQFAQESLPIGGSPWP